MPRFRTSKTQISGYKLSMQRREDAFVRRDTRLLDSPFASHNMATGIGIFVLCAFALAGLAVSIFSPKSGLGDATYVMTKSGSQYVKYNNAWHPVTNSVSAMLISGNKQSPKVVDDSALDGQARGLFMGMSSAPSQLTINENQPTVSTVCSAEIGKDPLNSSSEFRVDTVYIAGDEIDMKEFSPSDMTLVTIADKSKYWVIFDGKRAEIVMTDDTVRAALGIDSEVQKNAVVVSPKFLNAIPAVPRITPPKLNGTSGVTGYSVGTVITQEMPNLPSNFYVVTSGGIQQINEAVGRILVTAGSDMVRNPSVSVINNAKRTTDINLGNYPTKMPTFSSNKTLCSQWSRKEANGKGMVTIFSAPELKLKDSDLTRQDLTPTITGGDGPSADRFYTGKSGKGWFYQTTDLNDESVTESTVYYVSPEGIRYAIGGDDKGDVNPVLSTLGLNTSTPVYAPWQYLQILPEGPTLSPKNAMTMWESVPMPDQQIVPKKDGSVSTVSTSTPAPKEERK